MDENRLFKIGEVAKMYHVSMGTLRHYEKEGLLTPEYTDENTGYRYYGVRQLEVLNTIGYLRVLDMPLRDQRLHSEQGCGAYRGKIAQSETDRVGKDPGSGADIKEVGPQAGISSGRI